MYGIADVATVLGWSRTDVANAAAEGAEVAASRLFAVLAGTGTGPKDLDPGMALVPVFDRNGTVLIRESELARVEAHVISSRDGEGVLAAGEADDVLSATDAARLIGTSVSYVARLCRTWDQHRAEIEAAIAKGKSPGKAYIVAERVGDGVTWRIRREDLAAFTERRRQAAVRVGYDVTATTEKSLSILALLGGANARAGVLAAIQAGNDAGLDWLERNAACARAGKQVVGVTGWTVASFQHLTSRRLDPFVHHHNVVANTVTDEHGVRRALDARRLYQRAATASSVATAQARFELVSRLGVAFRPARHGGWEIAGIDDAVIDEFSVRTQEIRETVHELEQALGRSTTMAEFQAVIASTRPAKRSGDDAAGVTEQWWSRARARGLTPEMLAGCLRCRTPTVLSDRRRAAVLAALEKAVTADRSVFDRSDVLATLVDLPEPGAEDMGPVVVPAAVLEDLTDEFLTSDRVVALAASSGRRDHLVRKDGTKVDVGGDRVREYSTVEMLAVQARALTNYAAGIDAGSGIVANPLLTQVLDQFDLPGEQRDMVESLCTSGDAAQSAVGRPGTGKTYAMRAAVAAWEAAGYRVLGAAVKAEAARRLAEECGITAEPLAWYLNRLDDTARSPLDHRTVLVVDEASTVGDRDLDALLAAVRRDGAALRLVGDPAQHSSVRAGGLWRVITQRHEARTPELEHGRRVRHFEDRMAAEHLRRGDARAALQALEAAGHLHIVEDERDLYVQLLSRWWEARHTGAHHPMVDRRNDQRLVLNRLAQTMRRQLGELGDTEIVASGDRRYAVGDEVVARMGDRGLHPPGQPGAYVRNGARGTVIAVQHGADAADQLLIDFQDLGAITVPRAFFDEHTDPWGRTDVGIDHAYAVTSYAVEGLTFRESSSHVDPQSTRPEVYVDITRGRDANHVFVTRADDPLDGERLPAVPDAAVVNQLQERLAGVPGEAVAIDLDPAAGAAALARRQGDGGDRAQRDKAARAARRIARRAAARPDPLLAARLGGEPPEVYLARRYRELLAEAALYRARWKPRPGRTGPWVWALGMPPDDPAARSERDMLAGRLSDYCRAVTRRRLGVDLDPTAGAVVDRLTAEGLFGHVDLDRAAGEVVVGRPIDVAIVDGAVAGTAPGQEPMGVA
jgi:conjugative relaxase-like TrwC/TraI family protein